MFCCPECGYKTGSQETLAFHIRLSHPHSEARADKTATGDATDPTGPRVLHPQLEVDDEDGKHLSKLRKLLNAEVARRIERGEMAPEDLKAPSAPPSGPASMDSASTSSDRRMSIFSGSISASSFAFKGLTRKGSVFTNSEQNSQGSVGTEVKKLPRGGSVLSNPNDSGTSGSKSWDKSARKVAFDSSAEQLALKAAALDPEKARRSLQRSRSIRMDRSSLRQLLKLDEAGEPEAQVPCFAFLLFFRGRSLVVTRIGTLLSTVITSCRRK